MNRFAIILKSKTFWGTVAGAAGWLVAQPHIGPAEVVQAGGAIVAAAGIRDSITKLGGGQSAPMLLLAALLALPCLEAQAQIVDSLKKYCPPGSMEITATTDTTVVRPELYNLSVTQSTNLRAFQCGHGKAREVTRLYGIRWFSSDTTIIKVTRTTGRVTALREGEAIISASFPTSPLRTGEAFPRDATRVTVAAVVFRVRRT